MSAAPRPPTGTAPRTVRLPGLPATDALRAVLRPLAVGDAVEIPFAPLSGDDKRAGQRAHDAARLELLRVSYRSALTPAGPVVVVRLLSRQPVDAPRGRAAA